MAPNFAEKVLRPVKLDVQAGGRQLDPWGQGSEAGTDELAGGIVAGDLLFRAGEAGHALEVGFKAGTPRGLAGHTALLAELPEPPDQFLPPDGQRATRALRRPAGLHQPPRGPLAHGEDLFEHAAVDPFDLEQGEGFHGF